MGGIGYSERFTNVKGRDFEIPGTGGGVYLTSFNPDLAQSFVVGEEILCYSNRDEMLELIRYYLAHPEEARAIAARGRGGKRCGVAVAALRSVTVLLPHGNVVDGDDVRRVGHVGEVASGINGTGGGRQHTDTGVEADAHIPPI